MTAPEPIRIPCEGSDQPPCSVNFLATGLGMCAMCGELVVLRFDPIRNFIVRRHDRNDVIAMLNRGDFT